MATLAQLKQYRNDPNVRKFLDLLAYTEGTQGNGYHTAFGGGRLASLADHPRKMHTFRQTNGKTNKTSAAGRYQFLGKTWDSLAKQYGFKDFGAENQDLGAIALLAQNGALPHILAGNMAKAVSKAGGTWASLPSSPHPQPTKSWQKVQAFLGGKIANPTPQAPSQQAPSRFLSADQIASVLPNLKLPQTAQRPPMRTTPQRQAVQQAKQQALLVAMMGDYRLKDTGIGSGDHYDLRLARNANGTRGDINPYLNRFLVNGKGLNAYRQTGRYMEQRKGYRHEGVDFGLNGSFGGDVNARKLYVNPEFGVKGMRSFFDKHGGGWVTQVHFDDDIKVNILHQNRKGVNEVMNGWNGRQKSTPAPMTAQTARPQPAPSRFLSADQISKVLPNLAKATPMGAVAGMASTAGASVGRFLSSDQIAKVLPNLKLGG